MKAERIHRHSLLLSNGHTWAHRLWKNHDISTATVHILLNQTNINEATNSATELQEKRNLHLASVASQNFDDLKPYLLDTSMGWEYTCNVSGYGDLGRSSAKREASRSYLSQLPQLKCGCARPCPKLGVLTAQSLKRTLSGSDGRHVS